MKMLKQGFGLIIFTAVLAGCSSTQTTEAPEPAPADTGAGSMGADSGSVVDEPTEPEVQLDTVFYFDFDQAILRPDARIALAGHAAELKSSPRSVRLEGHADERGSREYNMALGERRANAVRDFLVLQGVDASLIETISYGEEQPLALGMSESSWSQNRRVELK
ncbi:peptidoglycan-associated lipoprotein Pal [Marinibactrum halimedae]|uniref:Peptidoglycan-associated lipoprotein n=1 Tax=Marinibactrum halimedae TaxID=1444977 RepID=A0AA37T485_9GAMM|nr:peptidoglycan-associated lipoprotein Pal [Marinibactrum halimedae]MCD9457512.1 peptidoglycan-associated lipoprotein Pal [Marinibactrum halimedae]GLS25434.1 peptidoglycan-associated lipoprotein [Marinibactrum halimedae]